jgi:hypothetical protein
MIPVLSFGIVAVVVVFMIVLWAGLWNGAAK